MLEDANFLAGVKVLVDRNLVLEFTCSWSSLPSIKKIGE